jgi:hypothetical protein
MDSVGKIGAHIFVGNDEDVQQGFADVAYFFTNFVISGADLPFTKRLGYMMTLYLVPSLES